jgi:predicted membrane protein
MSALLDRISAPFSLFAILVNLVFLIVVMTRTSRRGIHAVFGLLCVAVMLWNAGEFLTRFTGKDFWSYLSLMASALIPALMVHSVSVRGRLLLVAAVIGPILLFVLPFVWHALR